MSTMSNNLFLVPSGQDNKKLSKGIEKKTKVARPREMNVRLIKVKAKKMTSKKI